MHGEKQSNIFENDSDTSIAIMERALAVKGCSRCPILLVLSTLLSIACTALTVVGCLNFWSNLDLLVYMGIISGLLSAGSLLIWVTCQIEIGDDVVYSEEVQNSLRCSQFMSDCETSDVSDITADEQNLTDVQEGWNKENTFLLSTTSLISNKKSRHCSNQHCISHSDILSLSSTEDIATAVEVTEIKNEEDNVVPSEIQLTPRSISDGNENVIPFNLCSSDSTFLSEKDKIRIETVSEKLPHSKGLFSRHKKIFPIQKDAASDNFHHKTFRILDKPHKNSTEESQVRLKHGLIDTNRSTTSEMQARGSSIFPEKDIFRRYPFNDMASHNDNSLPNTILPPIQRHNQLPPLRSKLQ